MAIEFEYGKRVPTCNLCGDKLPPEDSFEEAKIAMKEAGWSAEKIDEDWANYCLDCKED